MPLSLSQQNQFLEIGPGWIQAILSSQDELSFIIEKQRGLSNNRSYWIAGSTRYGGEIDYFHYLQYTIGPGKNFHIFFSNKLHFF